MQNTQPKIRQNILEAAKNELDSIHYKSAIIDAQDKVNEYSKITKYIQDKITKYIKELDNELIEQKIQERINRHKINQDTQTLDNARLEKATYGYNNLDRIQININKLMDKQMQITYNIQNLEKEILEQQLIQHRVKLTLKNALEISLNKDKKRSHKRDILNVDLDLFIKIKSLLPVTLNKLTSHQRKALIMDPKYCPMIMKRLASPSPNQIFSIL